MVALKQWVNRNERLTVRTIFESYDKENFGELNATLFEKAMTKIGVKLRPSEMNLVKDALDKRGIGFLTYRPFVRELTGDPQLEFMHPQIVKLAKWAEKSDLSKAEFVAKLDAGGAGEMRR